ncbi:MAG: hypothetical protein CMJ78_03630 [Planctomycetaceae bacterium]|nr:hypothetical protein [Planctomycetaceae bacterium]
MEQPVGLCWRHWNASPKLLDIAGTSVGEEGIPAEWLNSLCEWPRNVDWMSRLGKQLGGSMTADGKEKPLSLNAFAVFLRNLFFVVVVHVP